MAEDLAVDEGVIDRIQNHITGVKDGLKGVYQKAQNREKRKDALIKWGDHIEALCSSS
jgi:hypothetical protein